MLGCLTCLWAVWLAAAAASPAPGAEADEGLARLLRPAVEEHPAADARKTSDAGFLAFEGKLNPLEDRLFADAAKGRLNQPGLWDAALVASGVEDAESLRHYRQRLAALVDELRCGCELAGSPRQQAETIFHFMHWRILRAGYRLESTDLRLTLDYGWFNCVSASILFNCLAEACGLPACGLETPGHAKSRLFLPEGLLDVETTCPHWFSLIGSRPLTVSLSLAGRGAEEGGASESRHGVLAVRPHGGPHGETPLQLKQPQRPETPDASIGQTPSKQPATPCVASVPQMVAMIYYNRGVDLLAEKRFAAAAAANAKALRLAPSNVTAKGNLLATINNWAIALGSAGRYGEAAGLLRQGMTMDPTFDTFLLNYVHVCHHWVQHLCSDGRFAEAVELLATAAAEYPQQSYFREAPAQVYRRWARSLFGGAIAEPTGQSILAGPYLDKGGVRQAASVDR